jgi:hypothetical protein
MGNQPEAKSSQSPLFGKVASLAADYFRVDVRPGVLSEATSSDLSPRPDAGLPDFAAHHEAAGSDGL